MQKLTGPAAGVFVRLEAKTTFIVDVMSDNPNKPKAGTPEWADDLKKLSDHLDQRIGTALPMDDGTHDLDKANDVPGPEHATLSHIWSLVIDNATRQLTTAMNEMLFDDQAAIDRDIAAAIGGKS